MATTEKQPKEKQQQPKKTIAKPVLTPAQQAAEQKRREMQKAKQAEAIAARARGEEFVSTAKKRKPQERRKEIKRKAQRAAERNSVRRSAQKAAKVAKATAPDVIVVPIFWKGQAGQMGAVLSVCSDAEQALRDAGWNVKMDADHKYTPGQKFAHWEHRGVRLRVEIGPNEASKGNCTLALTRAPGVPADRTNGVPVNAEALPARLDKLRALLAAESTDPTGSSGSAKAQEVEEEPEVEEEEAEEEEAPPPRVQIGDGVLAVRRPSGRGGDDLDDDFDLGPTEEEEAEPAPKKKKKRKEGEAAPAEGKKKKLKAGKGPKTVSF